MGPGKEEVLRINTLSQSPKFDPSTDANLTVLENYVVGVMERFKNDKRILMWDIYNEPGRNHLKDKSNPFLHLVWNWARSVGVSQPLTSCMDGSVGFFNERTNAINSDILTFHSYDPPAALQSLLEKHERLALGRPVLCTEFMARDFKSTFKDCVPVFHNSNVGCICWGLVAGKSQTIYNWASVEDGALDAKLIENKFSDFPAVPLEEPELWFHDIYRIDGSPFDQQEVDFLLEFTNALLFDF
jgi:hypothetical protein